MTAKTLRSCDYTARETGTELLAVGHPGDGIVSPVDPGEITPSGFSLAELGLSAEPDHSGLTIMGRFLADNGIGRMEELIRSSVLTRPPAMEKRAGEKSGNRVETSSVAVEVGSVCSLDANRIVRDFGKK